MEATIKFNLTEESSDFHLAVHCHEVYSTLWDIDQQMRTYLKHGFPNEIDREKLAEEIRETINDCTAMQYYQ